MRVTSLDEMMAFGQRVGERLHGGEVFELVGDVGAGKTTFTKGIAQGLGIGDAVQSPTFTISREYEARNGLRLVHFDFYRLDDAGIMSDELAEVIMDPKTITVIEWAATVTDVLPDNRFTVTLQLTSDDENAREVYWDKSASADSLLGELA